MGKLEGDQAWYWSESWQRREREVDEQVAAGQVMVFEDNESFLAHLDAVTSE